MAPRLLPNNNYAYYSQDAMTIILSTTSYKIGKNFTFQSDCCLIYAETIEITSDISVPGKSLGLFCHELVVPKPVMIDVSGVAGNPGLDSLDQNGEPGGDGGNSGNVWIFVQSLEVKNNDHVFKRLKFNAQGGVGGTGGTANTDGKTGGKGGNGGNGGDIEVLYGLPAMQATVALDMLLKRTWPEQVINLVDGQLCTSLPSYVPSKDKAALTALRKLIGALKRISIQAELLSLYGTRSEIREAALSIAQDVSLNMAAIDKAPTGITSATIVQIMKMGEDMSAVNRQDSGINAMKILQETQDFLQKQLSLKTDSDLGDLTASMREQLLIDLYAVRHYIQSVTKQNHVGPYGPGGNSAHGAKPGARGHDGKFPGKSNVRALGFDGRGGDLGVLQAYIFPEQCQMLLNKADDFFFSKNPKSWEKASEIYNQLLMRLRVLDALSTKQPKASATGLEHAWEYLEVDMRITNNPIGQLRFVYEQAKTRRNRLLLGQDMFGHIDNWAPRLCFKFYADSVKDRFKVLEAAEKLTQGYENAFQESSDVKTEVNNGIDSMTSAKVEAEAQVHILTNPNGPLLMGIYKIQGLSAEMKTKRSLVKEKMTKITFQSKFDPQMILDGFATLVDMKKDLSSLVKLAQKGYDAYKSTTKVENVRGDIFKKEYIIDQLEQCNDKLESLDTALKSSKNHQIAIDDPGALKVLASANDIKQLLNSFKNAIPLEQIKDIGDLLDQYIDITLRRNSAVLDYNSSIQLLQEAMQTQKYCESQANRLGERRLKLDPNIPAIVFWLRKTRDTMRLELMQRLNYESRAIRYWGLGGLGENSISQPSPLRSVFELRNIQQELDSAFERSLNNYGNNSRSTWPRRTNQQGLFYKLSQTELMTLKTPQGSIYTVNIRLFPKQPGFTSFNGRADIRITQVRLWLTGVFVNKDDTQRQRLLVTIVHTGDETFEDINGDEFHFFHDMVNIQFEYDTAKAPSIEWFKSEAVLAKQGIENNWSGGEVNPDPLSFAAIGPFTNWKFIIREAENPGLDMKDVKEAYIEFSGANRLFSVGS